MQIDSRLQSLRTHVKTPPGRIPRAEIIDSVCAHLAVQTLLRRHKVRADRVLAVANLLGAVGDVITDHNAAVTARLVAAPALRLAPCTITFVGYDLGCVHWCVKLRMHRRTRTWGAGDIPID